MGQRGQAARCLDEQLDGVARPGRQDGATAQSAAGVVRLHERRQAPYGNPCTVGECGDEAVQMFGDVLVHPQGTRRQVGEPTLDLAQASRWNMACWCAIPDEYGSSAGAVDRLWLTARGRSA